MSYRKIKFRKSNSTEIIGIIGTEHGVGATHLSCMLSVFLAIVKGYKVAVVELGQKGSLRQAGTIFKNLKINKMKQLIKMIALYTQSDEAELSEVVSMEYDYVIVDYGCDYGKYKNSFLMCPYKIIVGSLSWWRIHNYVSFVVGCENEKSVKHWHFLATSPVMEGIQYLKREFKIRIIEIPYEPDPFMLKSSLVFLHEFTESIF